MGYWGQFWGHLWRSLKLSKCIFCHLTYYQRPTKVDNRDFFLIIINNLLSNNTHPHESFQYSFFPSHVVSYTETTWSYQRNCYVLDALMKGKKFKWYCQYFYGRTSPVYFKFIVIVISSLTWYSNSWLCS